MADEFSKHSSGLDSPASRAFAIVPSDSTDLTTSTRGIYVGVSGDVSLITTGGDTVTLVGVPAGVILPIRASRVRATATTATSLVGLY